MDIIVIIITAYLWGKQVEAKGHSSYRWRIRHVSACFFVEALAGMLSFYYTQNFMIAGFSSMLALLGLLLFRYQNIRNLEPIKY